MKNELSNNQKKRTKKQAEKAGAITELPNRLALITLAPYVHALTTIRNEAAYLQPITSELAENLIFVNGKIFLRGIMMSPQDLHQFYDDDPKTISKIHFPLLCCLYTIILYDIQQKSHLDTLDHIEAVLRDDKYLDHSVKIYLPDLLKMIGYSPYSSTDEQTAILNQIKSFNNLLGIINTGIGSRMYPVICNVEYIFQYNTIKLMSPYFNQLILTIKQSSIINSKKNSDKLLFKPSHSFMIDATVIKEKNKRAVLLLFEVVSLIERAGNNVPHIKSRTLIQRCPDLRKALENAKCSSDANKHLKRAFGKMWELLNDKTDLNEKYKHLKITKIIPTTTRLDYVLEFPHT